MPGSALHIRYLTGTDIDISPDMTNRDSIDTLWEISSFDATHIVGGAGTGLDFNAIKQQAQPYCPATVAKYNNVAPSSVNRATAQSMANACLTEMGPFKAMFARGQVQRGIDQAFPANPGAKK